VHRRLVKRCVGIAKQHPGRDWAEHHLPLDLVLGVLLSCHWPRANILFCTLLLHNCQPTALPTCHMLCRLVKRWLVVVSSVNTSAATVQPPHAVSFDATA
jgi:hypothetical protein